MSHKWSMRETILGLETPLGVLCYTMVQERATYFNYDEMRKRIRMSMACRKRHPSKNESAGTRSVRRERFRSSGETRSLTTASSST